MAQDRIGKSIVITVVAALVIVAATVLLVRWAGKREKAPGIIKEVPGEARTVTLYFASKDADGLLAETRDITSEGGLENEVKEAVNALIMGPEDGDKISAIPAGTEINRVFWVEEEETAYLDFNRALIANHTGGSASEYYTIKMILKTIEVNFPQIAKVQFLVSGYPVDTIAGHYDVDSPLIVREWR